MGCKPNADSLSEDRVFRHELITVLQRIARALECIEGGLFHADEC